MHPHLQRGILRILPKILSIIVRHKRWERERRKNKKTLPFPYLHSGEEDYSSVGVMSLLAATLSIKLTPWQVQL